MKTLLSTWLRCPLAFATSAPLPRMLIASKRINPSGLLLALVPRTLVPLLVPLEMLPRRRSASLSLRTQSLKPTRSPCFSNRLMGPAMRQPRTFALIVENLVTGLATVRRRRSRLSVVVTLLALRVALFASLRVRVLQEPPLATGLPRVRVLNRGSPWPLRLVNPRPRSKMAVRGAGVLSVDAGQPPMVPPSIPALPEDRLPLPPRLPRPIISILCPRHGMSRSFLSQPFGIF